MICIKTEQLTAHISELGAELKSMVVDGKECIWQGDPEIWSGSAPLLFPICGGLKNDRYTFNGTSYTLKRHGFARTKLFEVESVGESTATFLLTDDGETRSVYPFSFELRVIFTAVGRSLRIEYRVKNKGSDTMYFSIGSHEAYSTPDGIENYDVIFPQKETLSAVTLNGPLRSDNTLPIIKDSEVLPLYDKYFLIDALVFTDLKSRSAVLRNRKTGWAIKVDFPDCKYFLLWHKYAAGYMCLEPWCGVADDQHTNGDITQKEGILSLEAGKELSTAHSIEVL